MDTKVVFLKQLALKVTSASSIEDIEGETVCEVLDYIVKNYQEGTGTQGPAGPQGEKGDKGDTGASGKDGKSVTAIALTTDSRDKVIGGTVTYSDESTSEITVSEESV